MTSSNPSRHKLKECLYRLLYLYHVLSKSSTFLLLLLLHLQTSISASALALVFAFAQTILLKHYSSEHRQSADKLELLDQTLKRTRPSATPLKVPKGPLSQRSKRRYSCPSALLSHSPSHNPLHESLTFCAVIFAGFTVYSSTRP